MSNKETMKIEKTEYPDGTTFYSYESAKRILDGIEPKRFTIVDSILILFYSHPEKRIFGRISLMKQIFLLIEEVLNKEEIQEPKFVKRHFGMYSFLVADTVANLEYSGYIERKGKKNSKLEQFRITRKGKEYISDIFASLPEELQIKIKEKRKGWDQLGYDGILRYVYNKYPQYREKSRVKRRYKPIKWGRGIG